MSLQPLLCRPSATLCSTASKCHGCTRLDQIQQYCDESSCYNRLFGCLKLRRLTHHALAQRVTSARFRAACVSTPTPNTTKQTSSSCVLPSHLISSHLTSSCLISSHLISSHLISSRLISSHLISSHLISFWFWQHSPALQIQSALFPWSRSPACQCHLQTLPPAARDA